MGDLVFWGTKVRGL